MKENNSITAEELIKDLQEVFDGNGVPNLGYVKTMLNEYKESSTKAITLEQLEEEVVKAYEEGIENALTNDSYISQVIGIDYFKKQVLPKYK